MKPDNNFNIKTSWIDLPDDCFKTLTFGELKDNQKFIFLPQPGDNNGHGGLKGAHYMFTKTHQNVLETENNLPYAIPHGRAIKNCDNTVSDFPNSMPVILVE